MDTDNIENKLAVKIIVTSLESRFPGLKTKQDDNGGIIFIANSEQEKQNAEQFNQEIGAKVDTLEVAKERHVNEFSWLVELNPYEKGPLGALAIGFADADESPTWRSVELMYTDHTHEKAFVNHMGTPESIKVWTNTVNKMRHLYDTPGLIQFQS